MHYPVTQLLVSCSLAKAWNMENTVLVLLVEWLKLEFSWGTTMKCFLRGQNSHCGLKIPWGLAGVNILGNSRTTEAYQCWVCPQGVWGAPINPRATLTESQASPEVTGNLQTPNTEVLLFQRGFKSMPSFCGAAGDCSGSSRERTAVRASDTCVTDRDQNPSLHPCSWVPHSRL